jgi:hypothetical protein
MPELLSGNYTDCEAQKEMRLGGQFGPLFHNRKMRLPTGGARPVLEDLSMPAHRIPPKTRSQSGRFWSRETGRVLVGYESLPEPFLALDPAGAQQLDMTPARIGRHGKAREGVGQLRATFF